MTGRRRHISRSVLSEKIRQGGSPWRPAGIVPKELLTEIRKNRNFFRATGYDMVDPKAADEDGAAPVDPHTVDWDDLPERGKLPFHIRQKPGPRNAPGRCRQSPGHTPRGDSNPSVPSALSRFCFKGRRARVGMVGVLWLLLVLAGASAAAGMAPVDGAKANARPGSPDAPPVLLVLEPVNLQNGEPRTRLGLGMVRLLEKTGAWTVLGPDSLARKRLELGLPQSPCREFQCAFDAANAVHAEFALYGIATEVDGLQIFALNLLHIPSARITWAAADEVRVGRRESAAAALEHAMGEFLAELGPESLALADFQAREPAALVPAGNLSLHARVVAERLAARLNATRRYDVMSAVEFEALRAALALDQDISRGDWESLGEKLGVSRILAARLEREAGNFRLGLAWAATESIADREEVQSHPLPGFYSVLHFEEEFARRFLPAAPLSPYPGLSAGRGQSLAKTAALALGMAVAAGFGYHAYISWENGRREARMVEAARSRESAQGHHWRARGYAQRAKKSAAVGVFGLAGTIGMVWAF